MSILRSRLKSIVSSLCSNISRSQSQRFVSAVNVNSETKASKRLPNGGPSLKDFLQTGPSPESVVLEDVPYLHDTQHYGGNRKVYFDVYGCQMNVNDTEIIWSILKSHNYLKTDILNEADIVLIVTCSIRDNAEAKIWHRINNIKALRQKNRNKPAVKIGILGCMAERLKHTILEKEKAVDLVAGPDSYKDLPRLLALTENNQKAINILLSLDETYADVMPVRLNADSVTAFVSIMRGCENMCTYCIVPFTRGRERSRPVTSIVAEVRQLAAQGVKEVTLLGQNVNSYRDTSSEAVVCTSEAHSQTKLAKGFKTVYKSKVGGLRFADLLHKVAAVDPEVRIRFTSPHPKDFPDEVLQVIRDTPNICKNLHLPAQSGNSAVLERMRRGYTRESYLDLVERIRELIPRVSLSSDFICGFCDETEEEFQDTLTLLELVRYNVAYLFAYSMREKTTAHRRYKDNVPREEKVLRVQRMQEVFRRHAEVLNRSLIGQSQLILVEGCSKKSREQLVGRNDGNTKVIIPKKVAVLGDIGSDRDLKPGDYVVVEITDGNSQVLKGEPLYHTTLTDYFNVFKRQKQNLNCSL